MTVRQKNFLVILVAGTIFFTCTPQKIQLPERGLCAHRGANRTHPENTLPAFREAIRLGAQMIEFDVRETRDSALVLLHDATVDRTTNGTGKVTEMTLAEIRRLDAGRWKSADFAGTRIPTLAEALKIMPRNVWLNIHIKGSAETGARIARMVVETKRLHQSVLACSPEIAVAARKVAPAILICNMDRRSNSSEYVEATIAMQADFIQLKSRADDQLPELVARLEQHGIRVNYFGTNNPEKMNELFNAGVDFPLVDDLANMQEAAKAIGIETWPPND